jgi:sulfur-oxidizing protein SoxY
MQRRALVLSAAALAAGVDPLLAQSLQLDPSTFAKPPGLDQGPDTWPKAAFEATTVDAVLAALAISNAQPGPEVLLGAPDIALATQPIRLVVETAMPRVDRVVLLADRLMFPLLAVLTPPAGRTVRVGVDARLPRAMRVRAYVRSSNAWFTVQREVKLALERG